MAIKKKAKSKKATSRVKAKKPAAKKVKKKVVKKKGVVRKPTAKKSALAKRPAATKPMAVPAVLPGEERVGIVTHYYSHLSVAIVEIETGVLRTGDTVHVKGHTSDFRQTVESMQLDHAHVDEVHAGQSCGLRVKDHAREHDVVYKVTNP